MIDSAGWFVLPIALTNLWLYRKGELDGLGASLTTVIFGPVAYTTPTYAETSHFAP